MSRWRTSQIPDQTGRTALVTGANSGLGLEIATELARAGATVLLGCRDVGKARAAAESIRAAGVPGSVEIVQMDLADLSSVSAAAASIVASGRPLHLLVNNAGLMAIDESRTADGFEMQFGVNHLGHFALTAELLPLLQASGPSRVVTMASMGHRAGKMHFDDVMFTRGYDRWRPYFQSKLANILFTRELHRRLTLAGSPTLAIAAHPGGSRTDLGFEGKGISNVAMRRIAPMVLQSAARGAEPALRAATDPDAVGGTFYGPRWITRGHAVVETPSKRARDDADAQRLWMLSEELTSRAVLPV